MFTYLYENIYFVGLISGLILGLISYLNTGILTNIIKQNKKTQIEKQNKQDYEEQFNNYILKILEIIKKEKGDIKKELDILSELADLKMKEYNSKNDEICVICLENLRDNTTMKNCNHFFHLSCLKNWHKTNRNCPICRK